MRARITLPGPATSDEVRAVSEALDEAGVAHDEPAIDRRRSAQEAAIAVVIAAPIAEVFNTIAGEAGRDAYAGLKRLVARLVGARAGRDQGRVVLYDTTSGPTLALSANLPDEAYAALVELDLASLGEGDLTWEPRDGRWRLVD